MSQVATQESQRERNRRANQSRLAVSRAEAAYQLDCSLDTVDRLVARGVLEKVQVGPRKVSIKMRSIQKLVERRGA